MADDVAAVIGASDAGSAHVMGASMGGFLARWAEVRHPDKVASLTVVMSGSAAGPDEPGAQVDQEMIRKLRYFGRRRERDEAIKNQIDKWRWLWGTHYAFDEAWIRESVTYAHDRADRPEGVTRNLLARAPGLWDAQRRIQCPTLVFHGELDPCFGVEQAVATARQIPKSTLWVEPGMGYTMHQELWSAMVDHVELMASRARRETLYSKTKDRDSGLLQGQQRGRSGHVRQLEGWGGRRIDRWLRYGGAVVEGRS